MTMTDTDVSGRETRIMYVCEVCEEHAPEACGKWDVTDLRIAPDGRQICDCCWSEIGDLPTWDSLPVPAKVSSLRSPVSAPVSDVNAELVAALRHALKLLEPFDDPELSLGLGSNALSTIRTAIAKAEAASAGEKNCACGAMSEHDCNDLPSLRHCGGATSAEEPPCGDPSCNQDRERKMVKTGHTTASGRPVFCDPCIAPIVKALNDAGIHTVASCCGHGHRPGAIALADGRWLVIARNDAEHQAIERIFPTDINGNPVPTPTPAPASREDVKNG